jgi:hypothetical protein
MEQNAVGKTIVPQIIQMFSLVCEPIITVSFNQPIIHVLIQMDPFGTLISYFFKNNFNIILPSLPRTPKRSLLMGFS